MSDAPANLPALPGFTPVPRAKERSNGWKPQVQQAFIEALADTGSVKAAARLVDRSERSAYQLRRHPEGAEFAAAWDAALQHGVARIEDVAMDRALNGVEVPVYSYGKLVGTRRSYNDRLLMFILRNRAPDRFAEGRAKALSALDKGELVRLRNKWRKEWEREQAAEQMRQEVITMASINAKIDAIREREERFESPRVRAARQAYEDAVEADRASGYNPLRDPEHELYDPNRANRRRAEDSFTAPPPGWIKEPEEQEPWDGIHRLTDEGWKKPDD